MTVEEALEYAKAQLVALVEEHQPPRRISTATVEESAVCWANIVQALVLLQPPQQATFNRG